MADIANLYWALQVLRSDELHAKLEDARFQFGGAGYEHSLIDMANAVEAELLDAVMYQGNHSILRLERLDRMSRKARG